MIALRAYRPSRGGGFGSGLLRSCVLGGRDCPHDRQNEAKAGQLLLVVGSFSVGAPETLDPEKTPKPQTLKAPKP